MRAPQSLSYRISELPPVPEVLAFLVEEAQLSAHAAYSTFNMGAGFALCCEPATAPDALAIARELGLQAVLGGAVEAGPRQVILEPVGVRYGGEELQLGGRA
jgi:phosphoribosylformylglycinamidine cyclo-ligase